MRRLITLLLTLSIILLPLTALAERNETDPASNLMAFVQDALDRDGELVYECNDEYGYYQIAFNATDGRMGALLGYLDVYETGILVQATYEQSAPLERLDEISRFMTMVNSSLLSSKYFLYFDSGDLYYERYMNLAHVDPALLQGDIQNELLNYLFTAISKLDYDLEYFMTIINGEKAENVYAMYLADYEAME